jgi:hypothetical protein
MGNIHVLHVIVVVGLANVEDLSYSYDAPNAESRAEILCFNYPSKEVGDSTHHISPWINVEPDAWCFSVEKAAPLSAANPEYSTSDCEDSAGGAETWGTRAKCSTS